MAKKKSKTQKRKINEKRKTKVIETNSVEVKKNQSTNTPNKTTKKNIIKQVPKNQQVNTSKTKQNKKIDSKQKNKTDVKYNVFLDKESNQGKIDKTKQLVEIDKVDYNAALKKQNKDQVSSTNQNLNKENIFVNKFKRAITDIKESLFKQKNKKEEKKPNQPKKYDKKSRNSKKKEEVVKPKNIFLRVLYELWHNLHIIFNTALIITFIILLIGLIRINVLTKGTILYISVLLIFLIFVAICYNKYLSGKLFTILIIIGMSFVIYQIQYTYDFINNLNSNEYEYKTYYVVTFNNGQNKTIYNINNKKVCLQKENSTNIERILNTKLDSVIYIEHENQNELYQDFYNSGCRAIIVNDNQYKYLMNNIENNSHGIKILYEFKANGRK